MLSNVNTHMTLAYSPWGTGGHSIKPFHAVFQAKQNAVESMKNIDAFILWGGEDIHPSFYGEGHHSRNQAPNHPSERDIFEWNAIKYCIANSIPIIGVCRGAQMLCAAAGGKLYQHVSGHNGGSHQIMTTWEETYHTTSAHHQMMCLDGTDHDLLAWSTNRLSNDYEGADGDMKAPEKEPEIVFFPSIRGLAIQGHPEWMPDNCPFNKMVNELIVEYLLLSKVE